MQAALALTAQEGLTAHDVSLSPVVGDRELFECSPHHGPRCRTSVVSIWRVRRNMLALIHADMRATCHSAKLSRVLFMMTFRLQPRQEASVVTVAAQSP